MPEDAEHQLTYDDLLQIVEVIKAAEQFSEFRLRVGDIEIELRRRRSPLRSPASDASAPPPALLTPSPAPPEPASAPPVVSAAAADRRFDAPRVPTGAVVVRAPMIGTFYRSPSPGAPPFVDEGQMVESDTIVCIIEVMKLMNSIPAGARGRVREVLVADGAQVETGAPLVVLDPQ